MKKIGAKYLVLVLVSLSVIVIDQVTKLMILDRFRYGETLPVISGFFDLTHIRNTGAAFGLLATAAPAFRIPFFIIVPLVALAAIAYVFRKIPASDIKLSCALSLVIGGGSWKSHRSSAVGLRG